MRPIGHWLGTMNFSGDKRQKARKAPRVVSAGTHGEEKLHAETKWEKDGIRCDHELMPDLPANSIKKGAKCIKS